MTTNPGHSKQRTALLRSPARRSRRPARSRRGVVALDDLDQPRAGEVQADDLVRPQRDLADLGDREVGRGRRQDRVTGRGRVELREDAVLDLQVARGIASITKSTSPRPQSTGRIRRPRRTRSPRPLADDSARRVDRPPAISRAASSPVPDDRRFEDEHAPRDASDRVGGQLVGEALERALERPGAGAATTSAGRAASCPSARASTATVIRVRTLSLSKRTRCTPRPARPRTSASARRRPRT